MSEIESVKPILTVIDDEGDLILSSTGPRGKLMAQAVLAQSAGVQKVVVITDGEMKVLKRSVPAETQASTEAASKAAVPAAPDVQEAFIADLEAGKTGEVATGEVPAPAPKLQVKRRPQIFQDAAAPPAPELAQDEMDRLLAEAAQAEQDAARVAEEQRFQRQQAVQSAQTDEEVRAVEESAQPRRRQRALATAGRPCGRCGGGGQIQGDAGFVGACPVCHGEGQVKTWDRALKVR